MGGFWGAATVIGPILFVAVLAWVIYRNRAAPDSNLRIAEDSAREVREEMTEERERREAGQTP